MDAIADVVRNPEGDGTPKGVESGSLLLARQKIEEVKAGLRDAPGRAYSFEFTAAAEILREHDPVQFRSLRRLLKDKQVRLGEFDRLIDQRRRNDALSNELPASRVEGGCKMPDETKPAGDSFTMGEHDRAPFWQ